MDQKPVALVAIVDVVSASLYDAVLDVRGYEVVTVCDGFDAVDIALARRPALLVVERMVPGLDAVAICRLLRARRATARIPIIVLTDEHDRNTYDAVLNAGADQVLIEPCAPELLALEATRLIDERRSGRRPRATLRRRAADRRNLMPRAS